MSEVSITGLKCQGCCAPLDIPKGATGVVVCPFCGTKNVVQGLVRNEEIKKKADINSGLALLLSDANLHRILLSVMANNIYAPLDFFEKANVLCVERVAVPAYYVYCNGIMNYSFEAGFERERQRVEKRGDDLVTVTENYTEWFPQQSSASEVRGFFAPANKEYAELIRRLFGNVDPNTLVDVERLNYPADIITYENDYPFTASFGTYVRPVMEKLLEDKAYEALAGRNYRNVAFNGTNVAKDPEVRVFLSFYRIKYEYDETLYCLYVSNNGNCYFGDQMPIDQVRYGTVMAKEEERDSINARTGWLTFGRVSSIIIAAISFLMVRTHSWLLAVTALAVGGIVATSIFISKRRKIAAAERNAIQSEIDDMQAQIPALCDRMRSERRALNGALSHVSGDVEAF